MKLSFFQHLGRGLRIGGTLAMVHAWGLAHAGSITLSTVSGRQFAGSSGVVLQTGALVRVGYFNLPDATRDASLSLTSDYATLNGWFVPLAEGMANAGQVTQASNAGSTLLTNGYPSTGHVFGTISGISTARLPPGTALYLWVFDAASPSAATQWGIFSADQWLAPSDLGARTLSTAADVKALQGSLAAGQIRLAAPTATYGNWTLKKFTSQHASADMTATADPDGDGICNLLEYAWQTSPLAPGCTRSWMSRGVGAATGAFCYDAPRQIADVSIAAEFSADLKIWSAVSGSVIATNDEFTTFNCTPPTGTQQGFWRLTVIPVPSP